MITRSDGRHSSPAHLFVFTLVPLLLSGALGCAVEIDEDHHRHPSNGQWNETHRPDNGGGRCTTPGCTPGPDNRPPQQPPPPDDGDGRHRRDGGLPDPGSPPAGPPPAADAGAPPNPSPTGGLDPEARCRIDAQCGGGRCQAGACQPRCTADGSCGTGHTCREGFCQPSAQPGNACLYSSSCPADGVCINGHCHQRCAIGSGGDQVSCANPADRCDRGVCQPDDRTRPQCTASAQCPSNWSCVDAICRTACRDDSQCGPTCSGTVCSRGFCVMPQELAPPMCPAAPPCNPAGACAPTCR